MKKEIVSGNIVINSGESLLNYLESCGLNIRNVSGINGSQNCIYLADGTSFNWKSRSGVRLNCKEHAKAVVEAHIDYEFFANGVGDRTRDYSIFIDNMKDLERVVEALRLIDNNSFC